MARVDGRRRSVRRRAGLGLVAVLLSCSYAGANNAFAQGSGCTLTTYTDPPRQVLQCRDGLEVSAESAADYSLINGPRGRPAGARLQNRGLFIDLSPGRPGGFQISTPHAVASVRGTRWAVDVSSERTSVFVRPRRAGASCRIASREN
jgi:ferric-dicitrate binding protein FerR (iron transport regulator)